MKWTVWSSVFVKRNELKQNKENSKVRELKQSWREIKCRRAEFQGKYRSGPVRSGVDVVQPQTLQSSSCLSQQPLIPHRAAAAGQTLTGVTTINRTASAHTFKIKHRPPLLILQMMGLLSLWRSLLTVSCCCDVIIRVRAAKLQTLQKCPDPCQIYLIPRTCQ